MTNKVDWDKIDEIHAACKLLNTSWALHYNEPADCWFISIYSTIQGESYTGNPAEFDAVCAEAIAWLGKIYNMDWRTNYIKSTGEDPTDRWNK